VDVLDRIGALGIVPVVELRTVDQAAPLLEALVACGLDAAEITLRTEAGLEAIRVLRTAYPDVLVGAGTVRTREDAQRVIDVGAQFVVSPATTRT
jgi:2-dehydro-3-deoxyphosphogluconate aldolase/(4S)-4-hydroxy-2-oxoglutarate aldolase